MNAREDIARLLQQWRRLTRAESEAIGTGAWSKLHDIQARKAALRPAVDEGFSVLKSEHPAEIPFRDELARLIALESHNAQLLSDRQQKARAEQHTLEKASQNLRNIRRSYTSPLPVAWNSYS